MNQFIINHRQITAQLPTFIVAELSGNHQQDFDHAVALIEAAAKAGADAVKIQTYTADTLTLASDKHWFQVQGKEQPDNWMGKTLHELYHSAHTPWDWHPKLAKISKELGLVFFSTPFDLSAVAYLESMNTPLYKIAAYEAVHIPLIKAIAKTGKPVIMSTGFATIDEITLAVNTLRQHGCTQLSLLHCSTAYSHKPAYECANLASIPDLAERFDAVPGFSDNNAGIIIPVIAATMGGAKIVEKHLILDHEVESPDNRFSVTPSEMAELVKRIRDFETGGQDILTDMVSKKELATLLGHVHYGSTSEQEAENAALRPSIWIKNPIKKGETLTLDNIRVARPSYGLAPKHFESLLGKKAAKNLDAAEPLTAESVAS